jgi:hypothetical protein
MWTILLQSALTVFIGVCTFVIGQILVKLCDPVFELRALFGEIARERERSKGRLVSALSQFAGFSHRRIAYGKLLRS